MANTFQIKRRTTGSAGAPVSLANGELAFNEVDSTMYYGMATGAVTPIVNIGGSGNYVTRTTFQTIQGDKAFTASVVLSSAVVATAVVSASGAEVANTEFVQGVFAVIDGGYFDNVAPPQPPVGSGKYFFAQTHNYDKNKWWTLDSWYTDFGHSVHATSLPAASADVVVLGTVEPTVDLDRQDWVQPNSINSGTAGIIFTSSNYGNVSCDITGPAIFNGTSTYNK
jgi:hypothetical protein